MTLRSQDDFGNALSKLQGSMDNLATSTIRARNREFPRVEINTGRTTTAPNLPDDYHRFCIDKQARDTEFAVRKREAITVWYGSLAQSTAPMREITAEETTSVHKEVEQEFVRELNEYLYLHPETEYKK